MHWREVRTRRDHARYYASPGNPRTHQRRIREIDWDDFAVVPAWPTSAACGPSSTSRFSTRDARCHRGGSASAASTTPCTASTSPGNRPSAGRIRSLPSSIAGETRQWGVLCFGYPEVRQHFATASRSTCAGTTGMASFLPAHAGETGDLRRPVWFQPAGAEAMQSGTASTSSQDFDLDAWRTVNGEFFTTFLRELRGGSACARSRLSVGVPRGDIIGPPVGNWPIDGGPGPRRGSSTPW